MVSPPRGVSRNLDRLTAASSTWSYGLGTTVAVPVKVSVWPPSTTVSPKVHVIVSWLRWPFFTTVSESSTSPASSVTVNENAWGMKWVLLAVSEPTDHLP